MNSQTAQPGGLRLGIVEPKLMLPRVQPGMLRRDRLVQMIDGDGGAALTVANAPVGYGKTTLLRAWCVEAGARHLDHARSGRRRPGAVVDAPGTAVERLGQGLGRHALKCLSIRGAPVQTAVDEVMNGLVAYGRPVAIVFDDLHAVRSEASLRSIGHAIERLPVNARLLATTRSDPAISLARLRARESADGDPRARTGLRGRRDA
jgi:LuxR family maltose regulon positive regulatory protein